MRSAVTARRSESPSPDRLVWGRLAWLDWPCATNEYAPMTTALARIVYGIVTFFVVVF
jgi:hypothetical protein